MVDAERFRGTRSTALSSVFVTDPAAAPSTLGYLGPVGTFTEQAVFTQPDLAEMNHRRFDTIVEVLRAVEAGTIDRGFAAIENMIEGAVNATIDTLAFDAELLIQREVVMNISMNLLVHPGVTLADIAHVRSIPVAYAQCRRFLTDQLPHATIEATNSTADAARELAESGRRDTAAIAPQRAGEVYELETLAADIEDHPENQTRFVLVGRDGIPPATGHDKSSIVIYQRTDEPGSLVAILSEFAARNINLTKLESRPTRKGLGDYCFLIDCEGHISDGLVGDALRNIHTKHGRVKFLGSYPSAYGSAEVQSSNRAGPAEGDAWLADLRARIR